MEDLKGWFLRGRALAALVLHELRHVVGQHDPGPPRHAASEDRRQHTVRVLVIRQAQGVEHDCGQKIQLKFELAEKWVCAYKGDKRTCTSS